MVSAILTDIEGTTTSIGFVIDVLFPYARKNIAAYIHNHQDDDIVRNQLALTEEQVGKKLSIEQTINQLKDWMDQDAKITPLKTLQGLIWEQGYRQGDFKGHIYSDVLPNLRRWEAMGLSLYVYSSGSVHAQKLLFSYSESGDITSLFDGYFDTRTGNKKESGSYEKIADIISISAEYILFLSDTESELAAAEIAGLNTLLLNREKTENSGEYKSVRSFDEINIETLVINNKN